MVFPYWKEPSFDPPAQQLHDVQFSATSEQRICSSDGKDLPAGTIAETLVFRRQWEAGFEHRLDRNSHGVASDSAGFPVRQQVRRPAISNLQCVSLQSHAAGSGGMGRSRVLSRRMIIGTVA